MRAFAVFFAFLAAVTSASPLYDDINLDSRGNTLPDLVDLKPSQHQSVRCGQGCQFRFCRNDTNLIIGAPDGSATDALCRIDPSFVGIVSETGEASISTDTVPNLPISQYRPDGLTQNFPASFFKTFRVLRAMRSGIGHQTLQGNQNEFLNNLCVRLPIRSYQRLNEEGEFLNRVSTSNPNDCVAFTTTVPRIIIEFMWQSGDDLDLHVVEPDGDEIFHGRLRSEAGRLFEDTRSFCGGGPGLSGRERTVYVADGPIENGTYTIRAQHFENCNLGSTAWRIRVFIDGSLVESRRGISNLDNDELVEGSTLSIDVNF